MGAYDRDGFTGFGSLAALVLLGAIVTPPLLRTRPPDPALMNCLVPEWTLVGERPLADPEHSPC
ncbi:MAG TPA: hypothetical protein VJT49_31870 [Amycolatopsis sp.]|uniref:hypothetical protein n=1 Tax=Amycolatopsis sp. TaxID=37632 RepID=UPI002B4A50E6|nr:hypothetical protein [Amycolatopsis sp.]HKS49630.1 hypothetical protein [Amycolatopsis sp.]